MRRESGVGLPKNTLGAIFFQKIFVVLPEILQKTLLFYIYNTLDAKKFVRNPKISKVPIAYNRPSYVRFNSRTKSCVF